MGGDRRWITVSEFPWYEVSDDGLVRSKHRLRRTKNGQLRSYKSVLLAPSKNGPYGHLAVTLRSESGDRRCYVHRLVLAAFVGPCPDNQEVRHLDGRAGNNRLSNLAYGTPAQNSADKLLHGTARLGESHQQAKLSSLQVRYILSQLREGCRQKDLALFYGVTRAAIGSIKRGGSWRCVTSGETALVERHARVCNAVPTFYGRT
jgi:hypothetical protein